MRCFDGTTISTALPSTTVVSAATTVSASTTTSTTEPSNQGSEPALFPIRIEGRWGYINREGEVVVDPQFDDATPFQEGLGRIRVGDEDTGGYGFVDATGTVVISPQFAWANPFSEGLALARESPTV